MHPDEYSMPELDKFMEELKKAEQTEDTKRKIHALEQQIKRRQIEGT